MPRLIERLDLIDEVPNNLLVQISPPDHISLIDQTLHEYLVLQLVDNVNLYTLNVLQKLVFKALDHLLILGKRELLARSFVLHKLLAGERFLRQKLDFVLIEAIKRLLIVVDVLAFAPHLPLDQMIVSFNALFGHIFGL